MTYVYDIWIISKSTTEIKVYEIQANGSENQIYSTTESDVNTAIAQSMTDLSSEYPNINQMKLRHKIDQPTTSTNTTTKITSNTKTSSSTGTTFNTPQTDDLTKSKEDLQKKITTLQISGLPPVSKVPSDIWEKAIKPKLLTQRQITKKIIIMQGTSFNPPISEEDAQLCVYGKIYYKNGKLYDNDKLDPACVAQPGDEDYQPPIDENHPMWKKINQQIKDLEDGLKQLGIKLGEFTIAIPVTIATIATSLAALVSSIVILPFGSGIPTAMTAVQTMMASIKNLQQKTAEILPLLAIIDTIGLLLPKEAQPVIAQINVIFGIFVTILAALTLIIGLLDKVTKALSKSKKKMDSIELTVKTKAEPPMITKGKEVKLSVEASGSDYQFTYEWTDNNGNIIPRDPNNLDGDDDGIRTIIPNIPYTFESLKARLPQTTYNCKVTDGKGTSKTSSVTISRI